MGELVDARTAARRLGVDVRSLYAYVSRGSLRRVPGPDGRSSRYDSDELDLLARRSRPRTLPRPAASIDLVIATRVSTVSDGVVRYRGELAFGIDHLTAEVRTRRFPTSGQFQDRWRSSRLVYLVLEGRDLRKLEADGLAPGPILWRQKKLLLMINRQPDQQAQKLAEPRQTSIPWSPARAGLHP